MFSASFLQGEAKVRAWVLVLRVILTDRLVFCKFESGSVVKTCWKKCEVREVPSLYRWLNSLREDAPTQIFLLSLHRAVGAPPSLLGRKSFGFQLWISALASSN
jgi:hypothetical protein